MPARSITIHLRSMERGVSVEFTVEAGKYLGLGSAADVRVPMAELPAVACRMGYTREGLLYVAEPDGGNPQELKLPASLALGEFEFMAFPVAEQRQAAITGNPFFPVAEPPPLANARKPVKTPWLLVAGVAGVAAGVAVTAAGAVAFLLLPPMSAAARKKKTADAGTTAPAARPRPAPADDFEKPSAAEVTAPPSASRARKMPSLAEMEAADSRFKADPRYDALDSHILAEEWKPALELAEKMMAEHQDSPWGLDALGLCQLRMARNQEAEASFRRGIAMGGDVSSFWTGLAMMQESQGKTAEAQESMLQVVTLDPKDRIALNSLISSYLQTGDYAKAEKPMEQLRKVDSKTFEKKMKELRDVGDPSQELRGLRAALDGVDASYEDVFSGFAYTSVPRAKGRLSLDQWEAADAAYAKDPEIVAMRDAMDAKDWKGGLKMGWRIAGKHPDSTYAFRALGYCQMELGMGQEAEASYKQCLAICGETPADVFLVAQAQNAQGKTAGYRATLKRVLTLDAKNGKAWDCLATSYIGEADYSNAAEPLEELRKREKKMYEKQMAKLREIKNPPPELQRLLK